MSKTDPLSYFLYDNRTRGPHGTDWGVKKTPPDFEQDDALRKAFVSYCRLSFDTARSFLSGFDWGLGGFRIPAGGYLLCVTLENKDAMGRPSLSFVGLPMKDTTALARFVGTCDPRATVAPLLEEDAAPEQLLRVADRSEQFQLEPEDKALLSSSGRNCKLFRFEPGITPRRVQRLLTITEGHRGSIPKILGVTSLVTPDRFASEGFAAAFALPPAESAAALERYLSAPAPKHPPAAARTAQADAAQRASRTATNRPPTSPDRIQPKKHFSTAPKQKVLLLAAAFLVVLAIFLYWLKSSPDTEPAVDDSSSADVTPVVETKPDPGPDAQPDPVTTELSGDFLLEAEKIFGRFEELDPKAFERSLAAQIVRNVEVLPKYQSRRDLLMSEIECLERTRVAIDRGNPGFYFDGAGSDLESNVRKTKLQEILSAAKLTSQPCAQLRSVFPIEFRPNRRSEVQAWCSVFEEAARLEDIR